MFVTVHVNGQKFTREQYINKYKDLAIKQMRKYKIPASITLAQGCLESDDGNSVLARRANNHFGIKCHDNWKGRKFRHNDDRRRECFRRYKNAKDSYTDHSLFLTSRSRYNSLFDLDIKDYKAWAHGLKAAGYATNPKYAKLLIDIIEEHKLYKYDSRKGQKQSKAEKRAEKKAKAEKSNNSVAVSDTSVYYVKEGDTLYSIGRRNGITVDEILRLNPGIKASELKIGTGLKLK